MSGSEKMLEPTVSPDRVERGEFVLLNTNASSPMPVPAPGEALAAATGGATARPRLAAEDYPLVDEALAATQHRDESGAYHPFRDEEIQALRAEVSRLSEAASELAAGTSRVAKIRAKGIVADVEQRIRDRPILAVTLSAAAAFIWGVKR